MKFKEKLLQGTLIKRYKRFFVDIKYKNKTITAHCPNTASMLGLLKQNNKVWFSKSQNTNRKLKYSLQIIEVEKKRVGINTHLTNKIVLEALNKKKYILYLILTVLKLRQNFLITLDLIFFYLMIKNNAFLKLKM